MVSEISTRVLRGDVACRLNELYIQACEMNDWEIHELYIQKDHVHMLLQINKYFLNPYIKPVHTLDIPDSI